MRFFNRYIFFARFIPGLISILPATIIYFFLIKRNSDYELREYFETSVFLLGISATFILTFFVAMVVREFGNTLEKRYFNHRLGFPTNYLMLFQNEKLPKQIKMKYREKVLADFGLHLSTEYEEIQNPAEAVRLLSQASRLVGTKYQQQEQVKDANIAYGFARNVSGGLFLSIPASISGIVTGLILKEYPLLFWCAAALFIFLVVLIFHKHWIMRNAEKYAEKLLAVYLSDK